MRETAVTKQATIAIRRKQRGGGGYSTINVGVCGRVVLFVVRPLVYKPEMTVESIAEDRWWLYEEVCLISVCNTRGVGVVDREANVEPAYKMRVVSRGGGHAVAVGDGAPDDTDTDRFASMQALKYTSEVEAVEGDVKRVSISRTSRITALTTAAAATCGLILNCSSSRTEERQCHSQINGFEKHEVLHCSHEKEDGDTDENERGDRAGEGVGAKGRRVTAAQWTSSCMCVYQRC